MITNKKHKKLFLIITILAVLLTVVILLFALTRKKDFQYSGWLNCMPPLSENQADLCRQAEEAGYQYIAY